MLTYLGFIHIEENHIIECYPFLKECLHKKKAKLHLKIKVNIEFVLISFRFNHILLSPFITLH